MAAVLFREIMLMNVIESRGEFSRDKQVFHGRHREDQHNEPLRLQMRSLHLELLTEGQVKSWEGFRNNSQVY